MTQQETSHHGIDRGELTRGAGLALVGRVGAFIEVASFPLFLWLYGPVMFGVYVTLWALVRIAKSFTQMGMDAALQRFLPVMEDEDEAHRAVAVAVQLSGAAGIVGAVTIVAAAPQLEAIVHGANGGTGSGMGGVIRLFAWTLPLWTLLEVVTACVRARREFGPEIRIRFFYEQILRIVFAVLFAALGLTTYGLFAAHILSMLVATCMAVLLLARFFPLSDVIRAGFDTRLCRRMLNYSLPVMVSGVIQRLFSELPVVILNLLLPGVNGAAAAGYYSIARKLSSILQVIYNSFDYVMAPLAAYRMGATGPASLADMYAYSARLMITVGLITGAAVIAARDAVGGMFDADAGPVMSALVILVLARMGTFLFGQATVVVRTLDSSYWELINRLLGLICMGGLLIWLVSPDTELHDALTGAALAASAGMVLAAALAVVEVALLHRMLPYSRALLWPLGVAMVLSTALLVLGESIVAWPATFQFVLLIPAFLLALAALLRYGLSEEDAVHFGRLGQLLR